MEYTQLFKQASRQARSEARRAFTESPIGQILMSGWRQPRMHEVDYVIGALRKWGPTPQALRGMLGLRFAAVSHTIERYARRSDEEGELVRAWLESMGDVGRLLLAMFSGATSWAEPNKYAWMLGSAIRYLTAYGYEVLPAPHGIDRRTPMYERARRAAWEFLRVTEGVPVPEGLDTTVGPVFVETAPKPTAPVGQVAIDMGLPEGMRTLPADHPIRTGEFVSVQSTNVHSVAYDIRATTLFVRFHDRLWDKEAGESRPSGPGPIYAYFHVPPQMFLDVLNASSKGGWVWDHLRIRGTVSGHQYDYRLVAVARGYVPRKATFAPITPGDYEGRYAEIFAPRVVQMPSGEWVRSLRPREVVRTFRPTGPIAPQMAHLFGVR